MDMIQFITSEKQLIWFFNEKFKLLSIGFLRGVKKVFFNLRYVCNSKEAKQVIELKKLVGSKHF